MCCSNFQYTSQRIINCLNLNTNHQHGMNYFTACCLCRTILAIVTLTASRNIGCESRFIGIEFVKICLPCRVLARADIPRYIWAYINKYMNTCKFTSLPTTTAYVQTNLRKPKPTSGAYPCRNAMIHVQIHVCMHIVCTHI